MDLLLVRHGIARDRARGGDDAARPLTAEGRRRMRRGAAGLLLALPAIDVWATSPLARAAETAQIVAEAYGGRRVIELPALAPEAGPSAVIPWLAARPSGATVALFGHEPRLGELAALLLAGRGRPFLPLKKGGACLLDLGTGPAPGRATLRWALTPKMLRALGAAADGSR